jgi:hypothetical protein
MTSTAISLPNSPHNACSYRIGGLRTFCTTFGCRLVGHKSLEFDKEFPNVSVLVHVSGERH